MRFIGPVFICIAMAVLASACGSGQSQKTTASTSSTTEQAKAYSLSQTQVNASVLTAADMPTGFALEAKTDASSEDVPTGCAAIDSVKPDDPANKAKGDATFDKASSGEVVTAGMLVQPGGKAEATFGLFSQAVTQCKTFVSDSDGYKLSFQVTSLAIPNVADETFALQASSQTELGPLTVDLVLARLGSTLFLVSNANFGSTDTKLTESVVRKSIEKAKSNS